MTSNKAKLAISNKAKMYPRDHCVILHNSFFRSTFHLHSPAVVNNVDVGRIGFRLHGEGVGVGRLRGLSLEHPQNFICCESLLPSFGPSPSRLFRSYLLVYLSHFFPNFMLTGSVAFSQGWVIEWVWVVQSLETCTGTVPPSAKSGRNYKHL